MFKDGKMIALSSDIFYDTGDSEISQGSTDLKFIDPSIFDSNVTFTKNFRYIIR